MPDVCSASKLLVKVGFIRTRICLLCVSDEGCPKFCAFGGTSIFGYMESLLNNLRYRAVGKWGLGSMTQSLFMCLARYSLAPGFANLHIDICPMQPLQSCRGSRFALKTRSTPAQAQHCTGYGATMSKSRSTGCADMSPW